MRLRSTLLALVALSTGPLMRAAGSELTHESPFLPTGGVTAAAADSATLQLAGISVIEPKTYVLLVDTANAGKSRSRWIAVGSKADDLEVLSCDVDKSEAVVRTGSDVKTLILRKPAGIKGGTVSSSMPLVGPAGGIMPQVAPLVTREEKEREARMLVSDLLEIGMRQRKAYEEAQRKAAEDAAKKGAVSPGTAKPSPKAGS